MSEYKTSTPTQKMDGKSTLEESDEGVYHVGSWYFIFLYSNAFISFNRGHN